ncbi:enoyl-CoA hydratase-related protein [Myxococcus sp. SDU36]|uniref:enoyl-CoA hydratase/isomerase family protein n=1 Tax=Myxococcus sp. SDU36 TaxID=2831967 RepID=UPI002543F394|nr:enoyl-CoA hydratase-related protein [Myxococcus sp. SDU36]WIG95671.1 enoyl-CoA hydratase/isomerase family protein [Myxococcus sp. SDU36]
MATVRFDVQGHVALITLDRPEARNALDAQMAYELAEAWERLRRDEALRVAIVTGAGDKAFCAGADLVKTIPLLSGAREPRDRYEEALVADRSFGWKAILRDFDCEKPVIAAINGHAVAGGMELAQAADLRVACHEALFGLQEVKWGLFPAGGSTVRLPRQIPQAHAMELLLTGALIPASQAFSLGFLNRVVSREELLPTAFQLAEQIAANGPVAVRLIRRAVRECQGLPLQDALRRELELAEPIYQTEDAVEGPRAFLEKRPAHFKGR